MKQIALTLALTSVLLFNLNAQTGPVPLSYTEVVQLSDSTPKSDLFLRAREWFNERFKSSKEVLQINDKESGELVGKGIMEVSYTYNMLGKHEQWADVHFTLSVWVKDDRYKYELSNFNVPALLDGGGLYSSDDYQYKYPGIGAKKSQEFYLAIKAATEKKAQELIQSLKLKMATKSKSSDW